MRISKNISLSVKRNNFEIVIRLTNTFQVILVAAQCSEVGEINKSKIKLFKSLFSCCGETKMVFNQWFNPIFA